MKFEQFDVWQRAIEFSIELYKVSKSINDYGFRDQITRAGLSVPSNIAEGLERESMKDSLKFLVYAKASCGEVYTQLVVGQEVGFIEKSKSCDLKKSAKVIGKQLGALIKKRKQF